MARFECYFQILIFARKNNGYIKTKKNYPEISFQGYSE